MDSARLYLLAIVGAITCASIVPIVRRIALAYGIVDRPDTRRVHDQPIARLGGVAMFVAFAAVLGAASILSGHLPEILRANPVGLLSFAAAGTLIFAVGLVDDIWGLRARYKLMAQFLAAAIVVGIGGCIATRVSIPGGSIELGLFSAPLTVLWIVAVTNSINIMDGLDGLAAGVVLVALGAIGAIAGEAHASVAIVVAVLGGVTLGFLLHNVNPATIFMGDSGSLFLGFCIGVLSTYGSAKATTGAITFASILLVGLPLADTVWAMARRYIRGLVPVSMRSHLAGVARMFVPDRKHIHHRLLAAGFTQRDAVYLLYGVQAVACAIAIYLALAGGVRLQAASAEPTRPQSSSSVPVSEVAGTVAGQ
jgi:UDP-GlcNAc:undecaprenyl-phosphate/decaprenyl-phosphate GlcNAc-1-phosphate transferase